MGADSLIIGGPKNGMVIDYGDLSKVVKPFVEARLDHWYLNESTGLLNPTSEELARWIFEQLQPSLPDLAAVRVEETCTSSCTFRP